MKRRKTSGKRHNFGSPFSAKLDAISQEMDVVAGLIRQCIANNAVLVQDQEEYEKRYDGLVERYEGLKDKQGSLLQIREERKLKADILSGFLFELTELQELDAAFSEKRWHDTVDHVTVCRNERLVFAFKNGSEITVEM